MVAKFYFVISRNLYNFAIFLSLNQSYDEISYFAKQKKTYFETFQLNVRHYVYKSAGVYSRLIIMLSSGSILLFSNICVKQGRLDPDPNKEIVPYILILAELG